MRLKTWTRPAHTAHNGVVLAAWIHRTVTWLNLCMEIHAERKTLARLSDQQLRDIGIHRADVDAECRRSVFDLPPQRQATWKSSSDYPTETRAKPF